MPKIDSNKRIKRCSYFSICMFAFGIFLVLSGIASIFGSKYLLKYQIHKVKMIIFILLFSLYHKLPFYGTEFISGT